MSAGTLAVKTLKLFSLHAAFPDPLPAPLLTRTTARRDGIRIRRRLASRSRS